MKRVWIFTLIWLFLSLAGPARSQDAGAAIAWNMDRLLIEIYTQPQHSPQLNRSLPFVAAQLSSETPNEWLGILFGSVDRDQFWVYELYDEGAQQIIKRVSLNEMLGVTQNRGCKVVLDDQTERDRIVTEYEIRTPDYNFRLKRFITLLKDINVAGGKRLLISFELENQNAGTVDVRFSVRHPNDDLAEKYTADSIFTINKSRNTITDELDDWPIMVQTYQPTPQSIMLEGQPQGKDALTVSTIVWAAKPVQRRIAKGRVELGQIHIAVTTHEALFAREQAENLAAYLASGQPEPRLSVQIEPDKWEVFPEDILTYRLKCAHTGTGKSIGGAIIDPIPAGVRYLPDTAFGTGTLIRFSTDGGITYSVAPMAREPVTHIKWEIQETLEPGAILEMGFQVQVE